MGLLSRIINYHGGEKIYNKEYVDELLALKQDNLTFDDTPSLDSQNPVTSDGIRKALDEKIDKASIEPHPTEDGTDKVVSSAGIFEAFALVNAPVGETMFWPVSECVDRTVVSDQPFEFDVHGKHYSVDVPDGVVHLNISKDIPTDWHALDGTAELDAADYPELAAFMPDNVTTEGKIWLPYCRQKIIKIKRAI